MPPTFRFAPSPNGYLHLGHAYSALLTFEAAKAFEGVALLRIEDIDPTRCKPEYDAAILDDLHWLGLIWPEPVMRQSRRTEAYFQAARTLRQKDLLYPCFCSRSQVAATAVGSDPDGAPLYAGTCRHFTDKDVAERIVAGKQPQWRLDMARAISAAKHLMISELSFAEGRELPLLVSLRAPHPEDWGDVVLIRRETPTSYHLAVVVDDAAQGITHVTRGVDLYRATDVHVLLQKLLDLPSPLYAHHDLVTDDTEQKLSKTKGSESLRSLRDKGWTAADVRRHLGFD